MRIRESGIDAETSLQLAGEFSMTWGIEPSEILLLKTEDMNKGTQAGSQKND